MSSLALSINTFTVMLLTNKLGVSHIRLAYNFKSQEYEIVLVCFTFLF